MGKLSSSGGPEGGLQSDLRPGVLVLQAALADVGPGHL